MRSPFRVYYEGRISADFGSIPMGSRSTKDTSIQIEKNSETLQIRKKKQYEIGESCVDVIVAPRLGMASLKETIIMASEEIVEIPGSLKLEPYENLGMMQLHQVARCVSNARKAIADS